MERWDFDGWAESYDEDVETEDWIHRDYWRVLKLVAERAQGLILDIGCGTGNILRFLDPENYIGEENGLTEDIDGEYFTTVEGLRRICAALGLECQFERLNRYVWIVEVVYLTF